MCDSALPTVDVIIPTLAEKSRGDGLRRAIESVVSQDGVSATPLVIINGQRADPELQAELSAKQGIALHCQAEASLPLAIATGRRYVTSDFFSFLDDDDYYLPHALSKRSEPMIADPAVDFVVANGQSRKSDGTLVSTYRDMRAFSDDPFLGLARTNWLASCGGTFRTSSVEDAIFSDVHKYHEWTLIAHRLLIAGKQPAFIDDKTFVISETPDSLSRSAAFVRAAPAAHRRVLALPLPPDVRSALQEKYSDAMHSVSELELRQGNRWRACRAHFESIKSLYGLRRHTLYSRWLLYPHSYVKRAETHMR